MKTRKTCTNISTLLKKRLLMIIAGVVLCCGNVWGAKFRWDGSNHPTGNWNDSYWEKETAIAGTYSPSTEIPAAGDTVYIRGNANTEITIPSDITAACGNLYLNSDDDKTGNVILNIEGSIDSSVNIFTNSGDITTGSATLNIKNDITIKNLYVKSKGADTPCSSNNTTGTIINLSTGKTLTITNKIELNSQRVVKADTNLSVTGNGTVEMRMFDYAWSKESAKNHIHELNIAAGSTVKVTENLIGDSDVDGSMKFTGDGNLYIPASGAYVNWATTAIAPDYASSLNIYPIGTPTYYKVTATGLNNFTSSDITVNITRENNGGTAAVFYPFEIKTLSNIGNGTFKIDKVYAARNAASETEFNLSPAASGFLYIPNGTNSKDIKISYTNAGAGMIQAGDGFKIEIRTPDNARVLSTIEWYFETPVWTGASSSTWNDVNNWSGLKSGSSVETTFTTDFPDYDLTINASAANMPEISSGNWSFKSVTISSNASLKMTGGELSVNKLDVQGFGHFYGTDGTDGTVKFKETGSPSVAPSLLINLKEYVTFKNLELTTGSLSVPTELIIQGNLNNKGTFAAGVNNIFIGGDFKDSGTWSGTGKIIFNGTTNQNFTPKTGTTYPEIQENKTIGNLTVTSALNATTVTLTKGTETTFSGAVSITYFSDSANSGNINFNAGGTINSATTFNTTDDVTFSGTNTLDFGTNAVTHTEGKTILKGNVKTSKLTIGNASLDGDSEIDGALDFSGGTAANRNSMARTAGTLKVYGNVEVLSSAFYTLGTSAITIEPITSGSTITFTNNGNLEIPHSSKIYANFTNNGTLSAGGSTTDSGCRIYGNFTNAGTMTIPSGKYFSVTGIVDDSAGTSWNGDGTLQFTGTADQTFINKTDRTYSSVNAKLSAGKTLTISNPLALTKFNLTSGNVNFSSSVTIGTYSETNTPTGSLTFSAGGTINSATTMATTGTVTIQALKTLTISDGAATPTYYDFTHSAGSTAIAGKLKAAAITLGSTTISGKTASVSGSSIATGAITATAGLDEFTLKASDGNFANIGQIGAAPPGLTFTQVTLDADTSDLSLNGNTIFANTLTMKPGTSKKIKLQGAITVNGTNGFVIPDSKPEVELTDDTTIVSSGPITLYDNITGLKDLTITNSGIFTLNESTDTADPVDESSATTLNSSAALSSFTQNGTSSCNISGDITSNGEINFNKSITLSGNVKLTGTNITFNDSIYDSGTNLLITNGTSTIFTGGNGTTISASKLVVSAGSLVINKSTATDTITFNPPVTVKSDITVSHDTVMSDLTVTSGNATFKETVSTNGNLTNNSKLTLEKQTIVDGNFTNSANCTTETKGELKLSGNFTDSGTFTENSKSKITFTGAGTQTFTPVETTTYKNINIDKTAGSVSFDTNELKAAILSDTATNASSITFNKKTTINSATTLNTSGTVTIPTDITLTLSDGNDFTHTAGTTALGGTVSASTINLGTINLTGDSSLTATTVTFKGGSTAAYPNTFTGTATHILTINGNLESDGFYNMGDSVEQSITLNQPTNSYTNKGTTTLKNINFTGNLTNSGTLSLENSTVNGDISNSGTLTSENSTVNGDISNTESHSFTIAEATTLNGSLTNAGTFTINSGKTFRLSKNFSNSGKAILTDSTFELITASSSQITGTNTFHNFTCTVPGKTISFKEGETQTVSGTLTLTGTSGDNNKISLRSTSPGTQWKINCTGANNHSISFVDVQDSDNFFSGYRLTATNSTDSGNNVRWDFSTVEYTWLGNTTDWFDKLNWDKGSVPGIGVNVIIPTVASPNVYPILEDDLLTDQSAKASIGSEGTITVDSGAQIDFADKSLTANTITNNGRIRLEGNQTITATTIKNAQNSTVEYYGLCSDNHMNVNSGSFNYYNLEFTNGATGNITSDITIGGRTLIANGTGNELKLSGNNTVTGVVTIGTQTPSPVSAGNIVLNSNTLIAIEDSIFCDSLTLSNDLIIDADAAGAPKDVITTGTISAQNIVLYRGHIKAEPNSILSATGDILILGSEYNIANPESGNPAEFLYQQQRGTPTANPSYPRPDFTVAVSRPDGKQLPTITGGTVPFSGSYSASSGSCLKAGKNFYANGTILNSQDSAQWYIDLPDITNSSNGFAETAYSTIRYATIRCYINGSADGSFARMPAYYCADNGNNLNWLFDNLLITEVHTVRDNAIQITFNRPLRNLHGELTHPDSIKRLYNSNGNNYASFHTAPDCTDENKLSNQNIASGIVFLKAAESWNTDATGTSAGTPDSTDRKGNHKEIIPYLEVKNVTENNAASGTIHITDIWGKKIGNYEGSNRFTAVTDRTGPVLYSIRTGQELHTPYDNSIGAESQPSYDSHNFIEFRYSEEVNFGDSTLAGASPETPVFDNEDTSANIWLPAAGSTLTEDLPDIVNVRVHDSFGALTNDVTQTGNLHFAGLGIVQNGQIFTGSNGSPDKYVNSLYRTDKFSIRLSIAGYTTGTVPDRAGAFYKNWPGYIESAVQPSGNFQMTSTVNPFVSDCALALDGTTPVYNLQELYAADQTIPQVNVLTSTGVPYEDHNTYSKWDISEPVFAPFRLDTKTAWGTKDYYEAVGNKSGSGSTLDRIEFHFFDNTPTYTSSDTAAWLTEKGWVQNTTEGSATLYDASYTYSADIIGGSRQFSTDEAYRTSGGIRYSTITSAAPAFKYIDSQSVNAVPTKDFISGTAGVYIGAKASLFTGYAATRHSPNNPDDLYFGLGLSETDIPISKSFTISYDDSKAYVTDLAGNRLRSATIKTIDRTPPSFDIVISPVNQKEIYMVFVKNVVTNSADIRYIDNDGNVISITENFDNLISKCFDIISINSDGEGEVSETHHIDYSVPAKIEHITSQTNKEEFTSIKITLQEPVTLEAIENMYLRIISPEGYEEFSRDPVTSINDTRVTFIQDKLGNYIQMYDIHALSDFAVSSINTLYAYDADMTYDGENIMNGLYEEGSWAVHDWNEDQQNYGTLPANHPFGIVADVENGTGLTDCIPAGVRIFLSANPDSDSISSQYNSDLNQQLRIWLPEVTNGLFPSISLKNNSVDNYVQIDSTLLNKDESPFRIHFEIPKEISEAWGANQQISFMYGLLNKDGSPFRIYPSPYHNAETGKYDLSQSVALPLYAFRLKDPSDITSIDLWSFKTRSITEQRGGVTILNNVINATNGEKTVVKVNMPTAGKLNVMVMTLDGNIITYLNHGETQAGEHYYSWDGKNNKKGIVARGMYFIRVVGNGLDETRKVMVVK